MKSAIDIMLAYVQAHAEVQAAEQHLVGCQRDLNASIKEALKVYRANDCPAIVLVKPNTYVHFIPEPDGPDVAVEVRTESGVVHASDLKPLAEGEQRFMIQIRGGPLGGQLIAKQSTVLNQAFTNVIGFAIHWNDCKSAVGFADQIGLPSYYIIDPIADMIAYRHPDDARRAQR